jgi:hypothetical protein
MKVDISEFIEKAKKLEKGEKLDLSSGEDLSIGIMNLISIEEHLFFSWNKTGKQEYYDLLAQVREMRKDLLKRIIKEYEGEVWCISKHLLAASMRLMEVGTKLQTKGDDQGAQDLFKKSYNLYSLFWGLNLGIVDTKDMKNNKKNGKTVEEEIKFVSEDKKPEVKKSASIFDKLGTLVSKAVDCCKE